MIPPFPGRTPHTKRSFPVPSDLNTFHGRKKLHLICITKKIYSVFSMEQIICTFEQVTIPLDLLLIADHAEAVLIHKSPDIL